MGIVTQDGLYRSNRMQFGLKQAANFFQFMIETILGESQYDDLSTEPYLDDLTAHHDSSW